MFCPDILILQFFALLCDHRICLDMEQVRYLSSPCCYFPSRPDQVPGNAVHGYILDAALDGLNWDHCKACGSYLLSEKVENKDNLTAYVKNIGNFIFDLLL